MDYDTARDRIVLVEGMSKSTVPVQVQVWHSGSLFSQGYWETQTQQQVKVQFFADTWEYNRCMWTA